MSEHELLTALDNSTKELLSQMDNIIDDLNNSKRLVLSNINKLEQIDNFFNREIQTSLEKHLIYEMDFPAVMWK